MMRSTRRAHLNASHEMITQLINAGYLQPALRNDPDAIAKALGQMKHDLRSGGHIRPNATQKPSQT
jgi:hypothetical protein